MKSREEVIRKFLAGYMEWDDALRVIKKLPKPWTTQAWKDRRAALIGTKCSTCPASKEHGAILVIQHTWQPTPWRTMFDRHKEAIFKKWEEAQPFVSQATLEDFQYEYEIRPLCPLCGGGSHRWKNSKSKIKKCTSVKNKAMCGHEFPEDKLVQGKYSQRTYEQQLNTFIYKADEPLHTAWRNQRWQETHREIDRRTAMDAFRESLRYMELHAGDVKTCCKSCAAREDHRHISSNKLQQILDEKNWEV